MVHRRTSIARELGRVLHDWAIDERERRRHLERRGTAHAFDLADAGRIALVVIDMVPFFTRANPYAAGIIPNVNLLAGALRAAGATVVWVVPADSPPSAAQRELLGEVVSSVYRAAGGTGPLPERLDPMLDLAVDDLVCEKSGRSAFFPGSCDLHDRLRARGIDTVLVAGTVANVCCESSVRDAAELGYRVVMVADANAAGTDAELNATLHTVYRSFGDVRPTSELTTELAR